MLHGKWLNQCGKPQMPIFVLSKNKQPLKKEQRFLPRFKAGVSALSI